jgi:HNH endonuclease
MINNGPNSFEGSSLAKIWKIGPEPGVDREEYLPVALEKGFVSIGWARIGNLAGRGFDDISKEFVKAYGHNSIGPRQLLMFANEILPGDMILLYNLGTVHIGMVEDRRGSAYYHIKRNSREDYFRGTNNAPHRVGVRWRYGRREFPANFKGFTAPLYEIDKSQLWRIDRKAVREALARSLKANNYSQTPDNGPYIETGEKKSNTSHRIGQGRVREDALRRYGQKCSLCDIDNPKLLVAGHIMGWSNSKESRGEPGNVILMCALHDSLFGRGFMSLDPKSYSIVFSEQFSQNALREIRSITTGFRKPSRDWPDPSYLRWHKKNVFRRQRRRQGPTG